MTHERRSWTFSIDMQGALLPHIAVKRRFMTAARPYALAHSGAILSPMTTRHQFYLPDDLIDARFGPKLDQLITHADANRHGLEALAEMLALFIQLALTLFAPQPPFDDDARRLGGERIDAFLELVERRLTGKGKRQRLLGEDRP